MILMLIKPEFYLNSARRGLSLYATSVLPSLFPFYFFSLLLTYIGSAKTISAIFQKPVRVLYNAPKESAYVLMLSMLSGYPVGASMTAELYSAGVITEKEAKSVAAFASTSGPVFILGTVGTAIFNDIKVGVIILIAHYISALLNGLIFRVRDKNNIILRRNGKRKFLNLKSFRQKNKSDTAQTNIAKTQTNKSGVISDSIISNGVISNDVISDNGVVSCGVISPSTANVKIMSEQDVDNLMSKTISNSTLSMLYVGGYIVLCGMLVDTLSLLNIDTLILTLLGDNAGQPVVALLQGLIEMTRGSISCALCQSGHAGIALCAGIISFGGLSVTLQNYTFLSKCKMTFFEIILRKFFQSIIAFSVAFGLSFML